MTPKQIVLKKFPDATFEESTGGVVYVRWFLFRDRNHKQITQDLIGCGETKTECYKDAADRIKKGEK